MTNLHRTLIRLTIMIFTLCIEVLTCYGQYTPPEPPKTTRVLVLCDLTLEDPDKIEKVYDDAKSLILNTHSSNTVLDFYLIDQYVSEQIFQYKRPKSQYESPFSNDGENRLRGLEKTKNDILRKRKADSIKIKLKEEYTSDFSKTTSVSRSCLFRSLEFANRVLGESTDPGDFKMVIFLSDMVVKCNSSFCGDRLFFTSDKVEEAKKSIGSCDTEMQLENVDKLLVIEAPTYTEKDSNTIRPEEIYKLWRTALKQFNLPTDKINALSIVSEVPKDYTTRYSKKQ